MAYCFAVLKMPVSFRTYDLPLMKSMMGFTFYIFLAVVVDQLNYGIGTLMTTWIQRIALKDAISRLTPRERSILMMRFNQGKTQMEVSAQIGISQAQVSRLEKGAIRAIKKEL